LCPPKYWLALGDLDQQRPADAADLVTLLRGLGLDWTLAVGALHRETNFQTKTASTQNAITATV
jgi:hypothetical protein